MAGEKILVVDDEAVVHEILAHHLDKEGYRVLKAYDGYEALALVETVQPDLILLDVRLPKLDGIEVCMELRKKTDIPILFVTAKDAPIDLALGFGAGGDDYIKKPFDPAEVILRVKAHLRRYRRLGKSQSGEKAAQKNILEYPGLSIDLANRTVKVHGATVHLTVKEFDLLALLAKNPDQFFSADQLIELVWNKQESIDHRSFLVHMSKLRKKIEDDPANPRYITTFRGVGYKFTPPKPQG